MISFENHAVVGKILEACADCIERCDLPSVFRTQLPVPPGPYAINENLGGTVGPPARHILAPTALVGPTVAATTLILVAPEPILPNPLVRA